LLREARKLGQAGRATIHTRSIDCIFSAVVLCESKITHIHMQEPKRDLSDCGVIYVATNDVYVQAAILSAQSAKKVCGSELKIHIYTDDPEKCKASGAFDSVELIENPHRRSKVDYMGKTPFNKTLFIDADTRIVADFTDVFFLLEKYDVAMVHAMRRAHKEPRFWNISLPYSFPQLNRFALFTLLIGRLILLFCPSFLLVVFSSTKRPTRCLSSLRSGRKLFIVLGSERTRLRCESCYGSATSISTCCLRNTTCAIRSSWTYGLDSRLKQYLRSCT